MHAVSHAGPELGWVEVPRPALRPGEVRVRIHATAVNRADLLQRRGAYPPPPGASPILGLECAGVVDDAGDGRGGWRPGDRVAALLSGGGYAEEVAVPAGQLLPLPPERSFEEGAALPEALCTVWMCLDLARARPGERLLVHAGASGIGTTALQVARELGLPAFATASADKLQRCHSLGAKGAADRRGDWVAAVKAWAPGGVDVVIDPVAGENLARDQQVLGVGGRVVVIGLMGGASSTIDAGRLLVKRQQVLGTVLRSRDEVDKARIVAGVRRDLWPAVEAGRIGAVVDAVLPVTEADAAHARVASDRTVGKVVLRVR